MKKILFVSAAILMAFTGTQAQPDNAIAKIDTRAPVAERKEIKKEKKEERTSLGNPGSNDVNYQTKEEFYRLYGDVPGIQWTKEKNFDEAVFNLEGVSTTAYFDYDAQLIGTTTVKNFTDLPAAAQKQINKEYKDYTVENVLFFDDNEDVNSNMYLYGDEFNDEDNYFVELKKDNKTLVVQVTMEGQVGFFADL